MSRVVVLLLLVLVIAFAAVQIAPSTAQDGMADRVAGLEARVSILEMTVAALATPPSSATGTEIKPREFTIRGNMQIYGTKGSDFTVSEAGGCNGLGGYSDIGEGGRVTVTDGGDTTIGLGTLKSIVDWQEKNCAFNFEVVVPESDFYSISIGGPNRGSLSFTFAEMETNNWFIRIELGGWRQSNPQTSIG